METLCQRPLWADPLFLTVVCSFVITARPRELYVSISTQPDIRNNTLPPRAQDFQPSVCLYVVRDRATLGPVASKPFKRGMDHLAEKQSAIQSHFRPEIGGEHANPPKRRLLFNGTDYRDGLPIQEGAPLKARPGDKTVGQFLRFFPNLEGVYFLSVDLAHSAGNVDDVRISCATDFNRGRHSR